MSSYGHITERTQNIVCKVVDTFSALKLKINPDKTKILMSKSQRYHFDLRALSLNGTEVKIVDEIISLGVKIIYGSLVPGYLKSLIVLNNQETVPDINNCKTPVRKNIFS